MFLVNLNYRPIMCCLSLVITISLLFCGCSPTVSSPTDIPSEGIWPLSVMIDGRCYHTFEEEVSVPNDIEITGYIASQSAEISSGPVTDDTSNFTACVGQPYAFVDGQLVLYYNGQWNLCTPANEQIEPT